MDGEIQFFGFDESKVIGLFGDPTGMEGELGVGASIGNSRVGVREHRRLRILG